MGHRPSSLDRFQGCILGAAIGDALGAPYEHGRNGVRIDESGYGVGVYNTGPGEPTDDSTLLRFHANAWLKSAGVEGEVVRAAERDQYYMFQLADWYKANPKDMGGQTRAAIES